MAWNPLGNSPLNVQRLKALGTQSKVPASGIEENQGQLYPPFIQRQLNVPQDLGVNVEGFVNPYSLTFYSYNLEVGQPLRIVPPNIRRVYLILQNQGPGNIWINFGQDVSIATVAANSNGMQLIETQIYEQIGGGYMDQNGVSITNCFVSPDYISVVTDTAGTSILTGEGVWRPAGATGQTY